MNRTILSQEDEILMIKEWKKTRMVLVKGDLFLLWEIYKEKQYWDAKENIKIWDSIWKQVNFIQFNIIVAKRQLMQIYQVVVDLNEPNVKGLDGNI